MARSLTGSSCSSLCCFILSSLETIFHFCVKAIVIISCLCLPSELFSNSTLDYYRPSSLSGASLEISPANAVSTTRNTHHKKYPCHHSHMYRVSPGKTTARGEPWVAPRKPCKLITIGSTRPAKSRDISPLICPSDYVAVSHLSLAVAMESSVREKDTWE